MAKKRKTNPTEEFFGTPPKEIKRDEFYGLELDDDQLAFANAIWSKDIDIVYCNSKAGGGKAQPVDTVIPTPYGEKTLGEINVGDYVFDAHGKPTLVLGVFPQGLQRAYKVSFSDGRSTICAGEHLWSYYGYKGELVTETLNSMMHRSVLMGDGNGARYNIPINDAVQYEHKNLPIDPYVIGAFLGDGCCREKYLSLSSADEELVAEVAKLSGLIYKKQSDKNYTWGFYTKDGHRVKTTDYFAEFPEVMSPSGSKEIPRKYLYGDVNQRLALLQGLMDTDGCITYSNSRFNVSFTTTSRSMADGVLQLIYGLGLTGAVHEDRRDKYRTGVAYDIHFRVFPSFKENLFRLSRKKEKARAAKDVHNIRKYDRIPIRSIEDLGYECDMVCIYVDNEEHLYLTNDYIVTHNTTVATGVANMLVGYNLYDSIIYIMSPYGERKQGWLPGTITEKSSVYFEAFYQALVTCGVNITTAINTESLVDQKNGGGFITCITDTFLRGSNLDNAVVIIDEAQNYTVSQLKTVLTRVKDSTKVIVIGHDQQCDLEHSEESGFTKYIEHFRDQPRTAVCSLTHNHRGWISRHADELM